MRKLTILIAILLISTGAFSQDLYPKVGRVINYYKDGKWTVPTVSIAELLADPEVLTTHDSVKVVAFEFTIAPKKGGVVIGPVKVSGSKFTPQIIEYMNTFKSGGGTIYIEGIEARVDRVTRRMNSITLHYTN